MIGAYDLYADHIEGKAILSIDAEAEHPHLVARASFWHINFYVEGYRFSVGADEDTDEIVLHVEPSSTSPQIDQALHPVLKNLIGRQFGWCWRSVNSQGYRDMLILGFTDGEDGMGVTPQIALLVEASSIHVHRMESVG
jgi:hypothetical protein